MDVLVLGGSGLISTGIVSRLLERGANVTVYNRSQREGVLHPTVQRIVGDRAAPGALERTFARSRYDVVVDMICFDEGDAETTARAFGGRCEQLVFCSTVCTYGVKIPPRVLIDEGFLQEPITDYARNKLSCERLLRRKSEEQGFALTIIRPSQTYGPGGPLVDQLEIDGAAWDRVRRGLPVFCAGDGLGLWQATHRDDCAKLFAHAAGNPRTYGEAYNATRDEILTWRDYYRQAGAALGKKVELVFAPANWILRPLPHRFSFLREVTQFHGAYSSEKARTHVPEFRATVSLEAGARETFEDMDRRDAFRSSKDDGEYEALVNEALKIGFSVETA
jgi:nucleoside-diphosphate-sugar epimerase